MQGDMTGGDDLDGEMACEALDEIAQICSSYRGRPKKGEQQQAPPAEETMPEEEAEASPDIGATDEADALDAMAEEDTAPPAESAEPQPRSLVSYVGMSSGKPSAPPHVPDEEPKRPRGRPRKVR